jgi:hypothetical protein
MLAAELFPWSQNAKRPVPPPFAGVQAFAVSCTRQAAKAAGPGLGLDRGYAGGYQNEWRMTVPGTAPVLTAHRGVPSRSHAYGCGAVPSSSCWLHGAGWV